MGRTCGINSVLLLDNYGEESRMLHQAFRSAGFRGKVVVIDDDGFLPEDVISLYRFFLGSFRGKPGIPGKPRYFNQINRPDYWEIEATNTQGKVMDLSHQRGTIYYVAPYNKRLVRVVDWMDEKGTVRSSDHYDCYGALYARTTFNKKGERFCRTYYDAKGREIIVENFVTHDFLLNWKGQTFVYSSKTEFIRKLLEEAKIKYERIFFNSLSTPFFVSQSLPSEAHNDILFWQEGARNDIPGNMQIILSGRSARTSQILVQKKESYDRLIQLGADPSVVRPMGFVYDYVRENGYGSDILICTNSDQIAKLEYLVAKLPEMQFHIAAITEMSSSLLAMAHYDNVSVYPSIKENVCRELFEKCDYYLDINYYNEILSAVKTAFLYRHLVLAFRDTAHNRSYTAQEHIFSNADDMIALLKEAHGNPETLEQHLAAQNRHAMAQTSEDYENVIG